MELKKRIKCFFYQYNGWLSKCCASLLSVSYVSKVILEDIGGTKMLILTRGIVSMFLLRKVPYIYVYIDMVYTQSSISTAHCSAVLIGENR